MKFDLLAKKGATEILLKLVEEDELNFSDVKEMVGSPTTASNRLDELRELGLIEREVQDDRYRSVEYSLTEKGARVAEILGNLERVLG